MNEKIVFNKNDYVGLSEMEIKKRLKKFPRKHIFQFLENNELYKKYTKEKLIDHVYSFFYTT